VKIAGKGADLDALRLQVLQELYHSRHRADFVSMAELGNRLRLDVELIRPALEDLSEAGLVVDNDNRYHISSHGEAFGASRWL